MADACYLRANESYQHHLGLIRDNVESRLGHPVPRARFTGSEPHLEISRSEDFSGRLMFA